MREKKEPRECSLDCWHADEEEINENERMKIQLNSNEKIGEIFYARFNWQGKFDCLDCSQVVGQINFETIKPSCKNQATKDKKDGKS